MDQSKRLACGKDVIDHDGAVPAITRVILGNGGLEVIRPVVRPQDVLENELGVGRFPQQEIGQSLLAAGAHDQVGGRSVAIYPVNYPASADFAPSANAGGVDANAHVESMAASCPNTKLVLGGYSQGAVAIDLITIAQAPVSGFVPVSLPQDVADHVAALALFGNPSDRYLGAPVSTLSPWYGAKAIDLCAPGDPVCTPGALYTVPTPDELSSAPHLSYAKSGMPAQAAAFVASHV